MPERMITCQVVARLEFVREGVYQTVTSRVFEGRHWTEGELIRVDTEDFPDIPLDAVIVPVTCTRDVFEVVRDAENGNYAQGERPDFTLLDGTAVWADTDEPVTLSGTE